MTTDVSGSGSGDPLVGTSLGPYRLRARLGEGGFGVVYLAEQTEPVRRRVAVKVIKPGMDSRAVVARFEAERQALALMDHPNVARVLDAGTTDRGLPYFVMELVEGDPITEFCDTHRKGVEDRIELMIAVCNAVQHAHAKGVIHRDLKPSNILVAYRDGTPHPKVIDFGVAKALNQRLTEATLFTERGQVIGTPEYMSPEQAEMSGVDVDTRSDIYSLGVLLYEVLTGVRPFEGESLRRAGLAEIQRVIREVDPPRPSTRLHTLVARSGDPEIATRIAKARRTEARSLERLLRRDLDWVVMRCLEKDRERRYETASAVGADLRRYLDDEPVVAGPPSAGYRVGKFVRRNRAAAVGGLAVLAALSVGLAGTSVGLIRAERSLDRARAAEAQADAEAERANTEREIADDTNAFLNRMLAFADTRTPGSVDFTVGQMLDLAVEAIDRGELRQPRVELAVRETIADAYFSLGEMAGAVAQLAKARSLAVAELGESSAPYLRLSVRFASVLGDSGDDMGALPVLERAYAVASESLGPDHLVTLEAKSVLGNTLAIRTRVDVERGKRLIEEALERLRATVGEDDTLTILTLFNYGGCLETLGMIEETERVYREVVRLRQKNDGDTCFCVVRPQYHHGRALAALGRFDEAESVLTETLETSIAELGPTHYETVSTEIEFLNMYTLKGDLGAAVSLALEMSRRPGLSPELESMVLVRAFYVARSAGEHALAIEIAEQNLSLVSLRFPGDDRRMGTALAYTGNALQIAGRSGEAEERLSRALEINTRSFGEDHYETLRAAGYLADSLCSLGEFAESSELAIRFEEGVRATMRHSPGWRRAALNRLSRIYREWHAAHPESGHDAEAARWRARLEALEADLAAE